MIQTLLLIAVLLAILAFVARRLKRCSGLVSAANTYDAAIEVHDSAVNRTNDAAITARHLLWQKGSTDTGVALNGAATRPLGTIDNTETLTGKNNSVLLLGKGKTKKMVASGAIAAGVGVYTDASGKVSALSATSGTYYLVGTALTATGSDGDLLEVADCLPVKVVVP